MKDDKALTVTEGTAEIVSIEQAQRHLTTQGAMALALLSDEQFAERLTMLKHGRDRVAVIQKSVMRENVDYGVIPGTDKPALLKPGAETLCNIYGLVPRFEAEITYGTPPETPAITVLTRCYLHVGSHDGPIVGDGVGLASTHEKRYRWRRGERTCPTCGKVGTIIKGKAEFGGGWLCWKTKGGCGAKFTEKDQKIIGQSIADVENPDPYDLANTVAKISEKRAHVDATLRGLAVSGLFTQDVVEEALATATEDVTRMVDSHDDDQWQGIETTPAAPAAGQGAPEAARDVSPTPTDAPEPSTDVHQGAVMKDPEGLAIIQRPKWAPKDSPQDTVKLEVPFKVGNSKHTAMVIGDLARTVDAIGLHAGDEPDTIRVYGERVELDWNGRGQRPMRKEIHNVTRVDIYDAETAKWVDVTKIVMTPDPTSTSTPALAGTGGPTHGGQAGTPSTDPSSATTSPAADDPAPAPAAPAPAGRSVTPAELLQQAEMIFATPPYFIGTVDETLDLTGTLYERSTAATRGGTRFVKALVDSGGFRYVTVGALDVGLLDKVDTPEERFLFSPGDPIRVAGTWVQSGEAIVLLLAAATKP